MKKMSKKSITVTISVLVVLIVLVGVAVKIHLVGFKNGHLLVREYYCSDVCPESGHWNTVYMGIHNAADCESVGGYPIIDPAWHGIEGCAPNK